MTGTETQGLSAFIPLVLMFLLFWAFSRRSQGFRNLGATLALKKFEVDAFAPNGVFVDIVGRPSGMLGWFLTVVGLYGESSFKVEGKQISHETSSRFRQLHQVMPLTNVSSTHCGYYKPIGLLIFSGLCGAAGIYGIFVVVADKTANWPAAIPVLLIGVIGALLLLCYFLSSKRFVLSVQSDGGLLMGVVFKRGRVKSIPVDINMALKTMEVINEKVIESRIQKA